jgi:hypothetical protein
VRRLVYSPKVHAFVKTDDHQEGVDISEYIVRGNVKRRTGAASTAEIELRNPNKIFTTPGAPLFRPMDPITIYLTRLKDRPIQVFTGYLDSTPYLQLFPGTVKLVATCTLKRLMYTYWDPSLPYVFEFLRQFGWNVDINNGSMFHNSTFAGPTLEETKGELADGSMGSLLYATLWHIGGWDPKSIYIESLPDGIAKKMAGMFNHLAENSAAMQKNVESLAHNVVGVGAAGSGGGPLADVPALGKDGTYTISELVQLSMALGLRGESAAIAAAVAFAESTGRASVVNSLQCVGLWQIRASVHHTYTLEELKDPVKNGKEMLRISKNGTVWTPAWSAYTNGAYKHYLDDARRAVSMLPVLSLKDWGEKTAGSNSRNPNSSLPTAAGAAPAPIHASKSVSASTPKEIIDNIVLPICRDAGINKSVAQNDTDNANHTHLGAASDHAGPPNVKWAADMSNGGGPTPEMDRLAAALAKRFDIPWSGHGLVEATHNGVRYQLIYRYSDAQAGDHFDHVHFGVKGAGAAPAGTAGDLSADTGGTDDTAVPGGDTSRAAAFAGYMNLPGALDVAESMGLAGQKSLLNDQPLLPFIQQIASSAMREIQSMPNGNFFAFFPDYFGGFGKRTPYWLIDDLEVLEGGIDLTDDYLATNVFIVGDISGYDNQITFADRLLSSGVMDMASAFKSGFVAGGQLSDNHLTEFLTKYGVRPYKEENPMIRSPYYEAFLSYQKFMQLWAKQFATTFQFTFMPELYPGGIVGLKDHGIQCYIEEVMHTFDYESGFTTQAVLSAPAAMQTASANVSAGMVRGFDMDVSEESKEGDN